MASIIPPLPHGSWSATITHAHHVLSDMLRHADTALHDHQDPQRLRFHADTLVNNAIPILTGLEEVCECAIIIQPDWSNREI